MSGRVPRLRHPLSQLRSLSDIASLRFVRKDRQTSFTLLRWPPPSRTLLCDGACQRPRNTIHAGHLPSSTCQRILCPLLLHRNKRSFFPYRSNVQIGCKSLHRSKQLQTNQRNPNPIKTHRKTRGKMFRRKYRSEPPPSPSHPPTRH